MHARTTFRLCFGVALLGLLAPGKGDLSAQVVINTVNPGTLRLVAGGGRKTITLQGDRLLSIASGAVYDRRDRLKGRITVRLAGGSPTRRDVTLRAPGNTVLGRQLKLKFTTNDGTTVSAENVLVLSVIAGAPTEIHSTDPPTLTLAPGESATVMLQGQRLRQLNAREVHENGAPVSDVTVSYVQSPTPALREIRIEASAGATSMSPLELVFTTNAGATVKAPLQLSVAAAMIGQVARGLPAPGPTNQPGGIATVSISAATPSYADIGPGGWTNVMLEGTNLDLLELAQVVRNGNVVTNATAQLQPSSDPTRRAVRLAAPDDASQPWNVPLELAVRPRIGEWLTAPVQVQVVMPDLFIASFSAEIEEALNDARFRFYFRNQGKRAAIFPAGVVYYNVDVDIPGIDAKIGNSESGIDFRPGLGEVNEYRISEPLPEGTYKVTFTVDPFDLLAESNESNNTEELTFTVTSPANLLITDIATEPATLSTGEPFQFKLTVRNEGQIAADALVSTNTYNCAGNPVMTNVLQPGESQEVVLDGPEQNSTYGGGGTHTCRFKLSPDYGTLPFPGEVEYTYTIAGAAGGALPDLRIISVETRPASVRVGQEYRLRVTVENIGPGTKLRATTMRVVIDPARTAPNCIIIPDELPSFELQPTDTVWLDVQPMPPLMMPAGQRDCWFKIEVDGSEYDTTNNSFRYQWMVMP